MPRTPSLTSLRLFRQVAGSSSFSETARSANLSQPALSRTIKLLEEDLGVRLFDRNSRNVHLTAAGAALLPIVERLTDDFDLAFRELNQTFAGQRGRVVVGALPSMAVSLLPRTIAAFRLTHPHVEIVVRERPAGVLYHSLHDRLIDLVVATPPVATSDVAFQPLMDDDCVLICRPEDAAAIPDPAPWQVFREFPFIGSEQHSSVRTLTDAAFAKADIATRALYECGQVATVGGLIAAGLGVSLMPRSTLPLLLAGGPVTWRALELPRTFRTIGVGRLEARTLSPAATSLLETLVSSIHNSDRKID
jgi:LysR family carnitine catabolism transcriptional activator